MVRLLSKTPPSNNYYAGRPFQVLYCTNTSKWSLYKYCSVLLQSIRNYSRGLYGTVVLYNASSISGYSIVDNSTLSTVQVQVERVILQQVLGLSEMGGNGGRTPRHSDVTPVQYLYCTMYKYSKGYRKILGHHHY